MPQRAYVRRTVDATVADVLKPNFISHEISADLKAGGERAVAARERLRALVTECDGFPRRIAERMDVSRFTVMRWLEAVPELDTLAKQLREKSGAADDRMAKARSARGKPKNN